MILTRLRGLVACFAILAFIVGTPIVLLRLGAIPSLDGFTWRDLLRQDDGTLALQAVTAAAWIAWAWYALTLLLEAVSLVRGVQAPRLPGLPQTSASRLVGVAALLFLAVPAITPVAAPVRAAVAHPDPEPQPTTVTAPVEPAATDATIPTTQLEAQSAIRSAPETVSYTVARGDSLWKIAETNLGDGARYPEIIALNPATLGDDPDFLAPGTVLRIPAPAPAIEEVETYVVRPGDTLTAIADEQLNDPDRYPEIFEASTRTFQPDGARLTDPDVIHPGWKLTIPSSEQPTKATRPPAAPPPAPTLPADRPRPTPPPPAGTPPSPEAPSQEAISPRADTDDTSTSTDDSDSAPSWVLPGLSGAGALLAGGLFLVVRQHQRSQRRYRIPGYEIAPPPEDLHPVEMTIRHQGAKPSVLIESLDLLLRMLPQGEQPHLLAAELGREQITLHLTEPATLAHPWTGTSTTWTAPADVATTDTGEIAPYPLLASLGIDDDGHLWLLNLEETSVTSLTGDHERTKALLRHLAAELAVTPWSMLVEVHAHGIAAELSDIDPIRLHHHLEEDIEHLDQLVRDIDPAGTLPGFDPDRYRIVLAHEDSEQVRRVTKAVRSHPERSGAAVVILDAHPDLDAHTITVTTTGHVRLSHPALDRDVHLRAAGLTTDEAAMCAAIVDITTKAHNQPIPIIEDTTDGTEALIDTAGALRPEFVHDRPDDHQPAGTTSILPMATAAYTSASCTTTDDVRHLAPSTNHDVLVRALAADPALDEDLAEWKSDHCRFPKLTLLGPVHLRANGTIPTKRRPYFAELLTYLHLHPDGVTTADFLNTLGITRSRLTADLSTLRAWLGTNPRTKTAHLPGALETRAALRLGYAAYQADDVLVDLDLFRRLRTRAQARGEDGVTDLIDALRLVTGEPFSDLRNDGWAWLARGQRYDQIAVTMIADTAHIVVTRALAEHDHDLARFAAETAIKAAPYDDIPHLDYARVLSATGHAGLAEQHLDQHIYNRDDGDGPVEPPTRSRHAAG